MEIIINGIPTPVTFPREALSEVRTFGSKDDYRIEYGNGLVELGGIVNVQANTVKEGIIEGTYDVELPFNTTYDFQATAMNVTSDASILTSENAFITEISNGYKIYATAASNQSKTISVKWSAKGVI